MGTFLVPILAQRGPVLVDVDVIASSRWKWTVAIAAAKVKLGRGELTPWEYEQIAAVSREIDRQAGLREQKLERMVANELDIMRQLEEEREEEEGTESEASSEEENATTTYMPSQVGIACGNNSQRTRLKS